MKTSRSTTNVENRISRLERELERMEGRELDTEARFARLESAFARAECALRDRLDRAEANLETTARAMLEMTRRLGEESK